jgi:hypothetical protein
VVCLKANHFWGRSAPPRLLTALIPHIFSRVMTAPKRSPKMAGMTTNPQSRGYSVPIIDGLGVVGESFLQQLWSEDKCSRSSHGCRSFANSMIPWVELGRVGLGRVVDSTSSTTCYIEDAGQLLFVQWVPLAALGAASFTLPDGCSCCARQMVAG